jgi:hypothetical protein
MLFYFRYASLYFIACVDKDDNELIILEQIHLFVEVLDRYFGNVCELDIIFNFHKAYYILDELFIGGQLQETSKAEVRKCFPLLLILLHICPTCCLYVVGCALYLVLEVINCLAV